MKFFFHATSKDWHLLTNWWTSGAHSVQASAIPTATDDVTIDSEVASVSVGAALCKNITMNAKVDIPVAVHGSVITTPDGGVLTINFTEHDATYIAGYDFTAHDAAVVAAALAIAPPNLPIAADAAIAAARAHCFSD